MSATPTPLVLSLDATYGALLVGTFIGLILYGTSLHQLFRYIWLFGSDVPSIRLLVAATMILETLHAATTVHVCYLEPTVLLYANWSLQLIPALTALTACVSKVFLARRAFLTGPRSKWAVIVIMMLLATELGLACVLSIKGFLIKNLLTFSTSTANILAACEATAAAADALLAGTIIATLWAQGYRARHASLGWHSLFMTYVIKSGLLTAILNVLALILAQTQRKAFLYAAVNVVTARVYANTLFTVLNSRKLMANGRMEVWADTDVGLNTIAQANRVAQAEMWNVPYRPQTSPGMIKVNVTAEREEDGTRRPRSMAYGHKSDMSLQSV
ncbi:hypothetical protein C2E23DRAFT_888360 [Lenzites betulinus]|nr:hypothetical protein C2E23DRAFT_888360 [Lenzites betulinus]